MSNFKLLITVLLLFATLGLGVTSTIAAGQAGIDAGGNAKYYVDSTKEINNLPYGIKHYVDKGMSSTELGGYIAGYGYGTERIVSGVYYSQQINILDIPATSGVKFVNGVNLDNHVWNRATVKNMAAKYERDNPGYEVIAGVNGDFFDINSNRNFGKTTDAPALVDGNYYKTEKHGYSTSGILGFKNDGTANSIVFGQKFDRTDYMTLDVFNETDEIIKTFQIESINKIPNDGESSVYYANYDDKHNVVASSIDAGAGVVFGVTKAEFALPSSETDFYGKGVIDSLDMQTLTKGKFAVVTKNNEIINYLALGNKIRVQFEFDGAYKDVKSTMGYRGVFLKNGAYINDKQGNFDQRHSRTVFGIKENGDMIVSVVDGRQPALGFHGMDGPELGSLLKYYRCVDGFNLDGGGSSNMIIKKNGQFVQTNNPSDSGPRSVSNVLLIVVKKPEINLEINALSTTSADFSVSVENTNDHDIQSLSLKVNDQLYPLADIAKIKGLRPNTLYKYQLYYTDTLGHEINVPTLKDEFYSLKREINFMDLTMSETENSYNFEVKFRDTDDASNLANATIKYNGKEYQLSNKMLSIPKSEISSIDFVDLIYTVDYNNGIQIINIKNANSKIALNLNQMINSFNNMLYNIYK